MYIAKLHRADVTAVDVSPLMLERARANVDSTGLVDRIAVTEGDIVSLSFADDEFDVVIAEAVTMFVDRQQAALWRASGAIEVLRERPIVTQFGKVLPFHLARRDVSPPGAR